MSDISDKKTMTVFASHEIIEEIEYEHSVKELISNTENTSTALGIDKGVLLLMAKYFTYCSNVYNDKLFNDVFEYFELESDK